MFCIRIVFSLTGDYVVCFPIDPDQAEAETSTHSDQEQGTAVLLILVFTSCLKFKCWMGVSFKHSTEYHFLAYQNLKTL